MEAMLHRRYKNPFRMPTQLIATDVIREGTPRFTIVIYSDPTRDNVEIQVLDTMQEREFNALIKQFTTNPKIDKRVIWTIAHIPLKRNIPFPQGRLHDFVEVILDWKCVKAGEEPRGEYRWIYPK